MSAGSNISGLAPLGSKKKPCAILPETANDMTEFDLVPSKSDRGQELLSPLVVGGGRKAPHISPNPVFKTSFGKLPSKSLAPLPGQRNLSDMSNDNNDPLMKSLKKNKQSLAPVKNLHNDLNAISDNYDSPIKRRIGANRIISPLASKKREVPMHLMCVSRNNLNHTLRKPKMGVPPLHRVEKNDAGTDGAFPDDTEDNDVESNVDFSKTLRDRNLLMETGHRMKNMIAPSNISHFPKDEPLKRTLRKTTQQPDEDVPWSTTTGSSFIF